MELRPFFLFYGAKWRIAKSYPAPAHNIIIEPFAGAAGYSTRHYERNVILVERDPTIAALWRWLISVPVRDICNLPLITRDDWIPNLPICQEAKSLIGFWANRGSAAPCNMLSKWGINNRHFWSAELRARVAQQVPYIRHWQVIEGDYSCAPDVPATWFIDPPYAEAGKHYRFGSNLIDYNKLSQWCLSRRGLVLCCENIGATWLPFEPHVKVIGAGKSGVNRKASM